MPAGMHYNNSSFEGKLTCAGMPAATALPGALLQTVKVLLLQQDQQPGHTESGAYMLELAKAAADATHCLCSYH